MAKYKVTFSDVVEASNRTKAVELAQDLASDLVDCEENTENALEKIELVRVG